ncbi:MAG TPA: glycosyl hydrolase family 28-related protein [Rhizomicrobium sp.]|nr:glycosyl hydrolase family 28-related protein [Rhizomicrobium sp.]
MRKAVSRRSVVCGITAPFILPSLGSADEETPGGFVSVRAFGAKGDGVTDDTEALIRAHSSGKPVFYPRTDGFYRISHVLPATTSARSNGAEIRIVGDGTHPKTIFRVTDNAAPIEISGLVLDGGYKSGGSVNAQWSHGIDLSGARNVAVSGNIIQNTFGDCVYVGSANDKIASNNIQVRANKLLHPFRCNVAVVCGENVVIENNICMKEIDFVAGIDLEPDVNGFDFVRRVKILNNRFYAVGRFITAGVNNGTENTDLLVSRNQGQALEFVRTWKDALLRNATITRNTFSATSSKGVMLNLDAMDGKVADNVDNTACGDGYKSLIVHDCAISVSENKFCS